MRFHVTRPGWALTLVVLGLAGGGCGSESTPAPSEAAPPPAPAATTAQPPGKTGAAPKPTPGPARAAH